MIARPHLVERHQQSSAQLQTHLNGLRTRSRKLRPIGPMIENASAASGTFCALTSARGANGSAGLGVYPAVCS